tara:strand:+ start:1277 stop:2071 length:795 start_codon:yes stop_codon:yes gene_type:complete
MSKSKPNKKSRFYLDENFIKSSSGRPIRILSEYYGPQKKLLEKNINDTIVFFGSARIKSNEAVERESKELDKTDLIGHKKNKNDLKMSRFYEEAKLLSKKITTWNKTLNDTTSNFIITSGGGPGIMEAANRGAKEANGLSIGLTISLPNEESGNKYITKDLNLKFHYFFMRKFWFTYPVKALVVWPGGFGTLDELMEILTLIQTGKISKRIPIVLFGKEFWSNVINWDYLVECGTISQNDLNIFHISDSIDDAFEYLTNRIKLS